MGKNVIAAVLLGMLAGCATTIETQYYTLDLRDSDPAASAPRLCVDRIMLAEPLSRKDILIQTTPTQIEYYATAQWAAGIDDLIAQKLEAEFGNPVCDQSPYLLSGTVYEFEQVDLPGGAEAHVKFAVEIRAQRYEEPVFKKTYTERAPANSADPNAVVQTLSACVERIAAQIMADAAAL